MSVHAGSDIVTNGLLFAYDMGPNPGVNKSWKGAPTTNLTTDTPSMNGWAGSYTVVDSDTKTFDIQTTQTNAATNSAWRTWYWDVSTYVGSTVTISGDVEFVSETNATFLHITIGQGNTGSFPYHIAGSDAADRVQVSQKPIKKINMSWSGVINATGIVGFTQWINNVTANNGNAILRISNVQIEVNDFKTPFVNGTRSNTQALLDWTNNNSVTLNSLIQNSDGTFAFDGTGENDGNPTGSYISFSSNLTTTLPSTRPNGVTYDFWLNADTDGPNRQALMYGGSTINHIEIYTTGKSFRTEAVTQNGYSFGAGTFPDSVRGTWSHFSIAFANDETNRPVRWYQNGKLFHTHASMESGTDSNQYFYFTGLGRATGSSSYLYAQSFKGKISSFKIYDRTLSAAEIAKNFYAIKGRYL